MPFDIRGVRSFVTFCQDDEPVTAQPGDIWYRPGDRFFRVRTQDGKWKRHPETYREGFGYVCGGTSGGYTAYSTVDRLQFPFAGTTNHAGDLSGPRYGLSASYSSTHGYVCGGHYYDGYQNLFYSTIDRFTFPFDSGIASHVGDLSGERSNSSSCASSTHGYACGGSYTSTIDRFLFPFDSGTASHVGDLSGTRSHLSACSSSTHGYACGGLDVSRLSGVDRFTFPFDSGTSSYVGDLSGSRAYLAACASSMYGYVCGGQDGSGDLTIVDRFAFPFDSGVASSTGSLTADRIQLSACSSSTFGYVCSGYSNSRLIYLSIIDRFQFPFDSGTSSHAGNLSGARAEQAACSSVDPHLRW